MTSNAQAKLDYIAGTKTAIGNAIVAKGVDLGTSTFRQYADRIGEIAAPTGWTKPAAWIDISTVGDNEINLLVTEGTGIAFTTTVASSGTYTIDWGDGTVETDRESGTIYMHQHTANGTAWGATYTWKIRIYGATGNITAWKVSRHTYIKRKQYHPILWAVFGTTAITDYANTFYNATGEYVECRDLQACVIPSFDSCSSTSYMFNFCYSLSSITLPTSWGSVSNTSSMFAYCFALSSITLPTSWGSVSDASYMFSDCYSLKLINNINYLGSESVACNFTDFANDCEFLQTDISIGSLISKIGIYGEAGFVLKVDSIRLTNGNSTFGGTSPQVDVSYTSLDATALNTLFGDLPTLVGKTIKITGATGAATCDTSIATGKGWSVTN
jgi:hypothetical protein